MVKFEINLSAIGLFQKLCDPVYIWGKLEIYIGQSPHFSHNYIQNLAIYRSKLVQPYRTKITFCAKECLLLYTSSDLVQGFGEQSPFLSSDKSD